MDVRPVGQADLVAAEVLLDDLLAGRVQARLGEAHDVLALPTLGVWDHERLVGLATWSPAGDGDRSELAALAVAPDRQGRGVGGALVEAVAEAARASGAATLWLVTTNDNLDALRLYQRHGFRLGNREQSQLADGYRDRADRLFWDSRNVRGLPQEKEQIERAKEDYERALELYETIAPWGNASANIVRVESSLDSVEFRLQEIAGQPVFK